MPAGPPIAARALFEAAPLLESAPDAMLVVDARDRITLVNAELERLFGWPRAELIGRSVGVLFAERFDVGRSGVRLNPPGESAPRQLGDGLDLYGRRRDGSEFPVEVRVSPVHTERGRFASAAIRDVSERIRAHEWRMLLATIVDSTDDAIVSRTLDGIVTSWNPAAQRIFGYHADEMIGRPISILVPPGRESEEEEIVQGLREGRSFQTHETVRRRKDGRDVEVSETISPLRDARGDLIGASTIARDITRRKAAERGAAQAREQAELLNRELEAFSYSVAHDLRAPLRSIDGFSRALLAEHQGVLNEEAQKHLTRVRDSAKHMSKLIDALLDLSRISRHELRMRRVDLSALAHQTVQRLRELQPGREVSVSIEEGMRVRGDPTLLGVLVDNLVGNAWKFTARTARSSIEIGVVRQCEAVYFVRDNGAGFDMNHAHKLFNVFQRLHRRDEFEGTGIGLATAQRIVQRHGGRIWAESAKDRGATFFFTLDTQAS